MMNRNDLAPADGVGAPDGHPAERTSIMRFLATGLLVLGLAAPALRADDKPAKPSEAFEALKKEFDESDKKPEFAPRFLEFAEKNPMDSSAFDALVLALRISGPDDKEGVWAKAMEAVRANYATKPEVKRLVRLLAGVNDEASEKLIREVMAKHPDKKTQAVACKSLAAGKAQAAEFAEKIKGDDALKSRAEEKLGKERVEKMLAGAEKAKKESEELKQTLKDKYGDVFPDLSIGKKVPEVVSQDADGKEVKLSEFKGKVTVVDIWATWCPPCRAMIPHEREMVERLKDKPFALVSISCDDTKKALTDFLAKEKMPWNQWWNGSEGGVAEDWDVQFFPTIYVIDAKGVIRHKDLRGEELENAVNDLLKEAEEKK
jgi:thiol-disulfide isomerase/thioredoxin